jgi:hypothetical protein
MEKLLGNQTPNFAEIRKTLVGLGNVLIQAELAESIELRYYDCLQDLTFKCGNFEYSINPSFPFDEATFTAFIDEVKSFMKSVIKDYEDRIFKMECSKAVMEVYLTEKEK